MSRPFLAIGFAALIASYFALSGGISEVVLILLLSTAIIVLFTVINKQKIFKGVAIALIFVAVILRLVCLMSFVEKTNQKIVGRTANIQGTVTSILSNQKNFSRYIIKISDSSNLAAKDITVDATMFEHTSAIPGDIVTATVTFVKPEDRYKGYNFSNGRYFSCEVQRIQATENNRLSIWRIAHNLREGVRKAISKSGSGEESAVLNALIIGETSGISEELSKNVKAAGVSHMLVVSGMHLGIICGVLINALHRRTKRWVTAVIGLLTAAFITVLCLFHVSIIRASIAYFVMLFGRAAKHNSDGLNSLGFGVTVAVFACPYIFHNVAFLLSVTATFAVLYPSQMLIKAVSFDKLGKFTKPVKYVYEILAISVCAMICTLPVVSHYFGYVALIAPVTNLAVTFAVSVALIFGAAATLTSFIPVISIFCLPLYFVARICVSYFIKAVNFIGGSGYGVLNIAPSENIYCFFIPLAFILLVRVFYKYQQKRKERAQLVK